MEPTVRPWWRRDIGRPRWGAYILLWLGYGIAGIVAVTANFFPLLLLAWGGYCGGLVLFWKPGGPEPTTPPPLPWRRAAICGGLSMLPFILAWPIVT